MTKAREDDPDIPKFIYSCGLKSSHLWSLSDFGLLDVLQSLKAWCFPVPFNQISDFEGCSLNRKLYTIIYDPNSLKWLTQTWTTQGWVASFFVAISFETGQFANYHHNDNVVRLSSDW